MADKVKKGFYRRVSFAKPTFVQALTRFARGDLREKEKDFYHRCDQSNKQTCDNIIAHNTCERNSRDRYELRAINTEKRSTDIS